MKNIEVIPDEIKTIDIDSFSFKVVGDEANHFYMTLGEAKEVFGSKIDTINKSINNNIEDFELGIDYITANMLSSEILSELNIAPNNAKKVKLLSKSGVILLGMFLKSEKAKQFRKIAKHIIVKALDNKPNEIELVNIDLTNDMLESSIQKDLQIKAKDEEIENLKKHLQKTLTKKYYDVITPLEHNRIKEMFENNFSIPEMEKELGLTRNQVEQSLGKQGLYTPTVPEKDALFGVNIENFYYYNNSK